MNVMSPLLHKYVPCIAAGGKGKGSGKPAHMDKSSRGMAGLGAELYGNGGSRVTVPPVKDLVSPKLSELTVRTLTGARWSSCGGNIEMERSRHPATLISGGIWVIRRDGGLPQPFLFARSTPACVLA